MSTMPWDRYAAQAQAPPQGAAQMPWEKYASGGSAAPQQDFSRLTANPKGEGTYQISTPDAQKLDVPYSNVDSLIGLHGFNFSSPDEQNRFAKDAGVDPNSVHSSAARKFLSGLIDPVGTGGADQGVVGGIRQVGGQAIATAAQPALHPIKTLEGAAKTAAYAGGTALGVPMPEAWDPVTPVVEGFMRDKQQGGMPLAAENLAGDVLGTVEGGRAMGAAVSGVEPSAALGPAGEAPAPGAAGPVNTVGGANRLIPEAVRNGTLPSAWNWGLPKVEAPVKAALAGDVNAPIAGNESGLTPAQRYASMKNMGVQPDAAQATGGALLPRIAKAGGQYSLTSEPTYAAAQAKNLEVLDNYAHDAVNEIDPVGGQNISQKLLQAHADQKAVARAGFDQLDEEIGPGAIPGAPGIRAAARRILASNQLTSVSQALEPTQTLQIIKDIAGLDDKGEPLKNPPDLSYGQMQRLRSNLLEFNNNNPALVKSEADAWISSLAGKVDDAMTAPRGGMTPSQIKLFRDSNTAWANLKATFDNPQHPFFSAVRTVAPSQVPTMLSQGLSRTPEIVGQLQDALGSDQTDGLGPIRRAVLEKSFGADANGDYNFKTFQRNFEKIPQRYRDALFTPEQQQQFSQIGDAGATLTADVNPSGSAKQAQRAGELMEGAASVAHPVLLGKTLAYHAGQFGLGKLMNHPAFVDWLMRDRGLPPAPTGANTNMPPANAMIPAAVASGAMSSSWDFQNNRPKPQ